MLINSFLLQLLIKLYTFWIKKLVYIYQLNIFLSKDPKCNQSKTLMAKIANNICIRKLETVSNQPHLLSVRNMFICNPLARKYIDLELGSLLSLFQKFSLMNSENMHHRMVIWLWKDWKSWEKILLIGSMKHKSCNLLKKIS